MKHFFTLKQKVCSCKNSIIYYHKAPYSIAFMIDEDASSKIVKSEEETAYSDEEFKCLQGDVGGSPSYSPMTFFLVNDEVSLWLGKSFNYNFQGVFQGQKLESWVYLDATNCSQVIRKP